MDKNQLFASDISDEIKSEEREIKETSGFFLKALLIVLIVLFLPLISGLFVVEPVKTTMEFTGNVSVEDINEVDIETDEVIGCPYWETGGCLVYGCNGERPIPATYKIVTTTHFRITTLTFDWMGKKRGVEDRKILWQKKIKYTKKDEWKQEELK